MPIRVCSALLRLTPRRHSVRLFGSLAACLALFVAPLTSIPVLAQDSAALLPPLGPARSLQLPQIVQKTLSNGLKLVVLEDHTQPALWIRLAFPAGAIRDSREKAGVASLTAGLLTKGTTTRTEPQIADTVDGLGAKLDASVDNDFLIVSADGLSTQRDTLFDLLADITLHPTFPQEELDRTRTQTLSGLTVSLAEGGALANAALARLVYGAHPYGDMTSGDPTSLPKITRADLVQFHHTYFAPNVAMLFVAGDITPEQAQQKAEQTLGSWERRDVPALPAPPTPPAKAGNVPQITLIDRPGAAQTEIRIGALIPGYNDPYRTAGLVASAVLGMGQFEGRLTKEIRVKRGLTYGVESYFLRYQQAGMFTIDTFTKNKSTGEVIRLALEEARKLDHELTPATELQDRKSYLIGDFSVSVVTTPALLQRLVYTLLYGKTPEYLAGFPERIQEVTAQQVQDAMNTVDLTSPQIVLVGDANEVKSQVQTLGNVRIIKASDVDLNSPNLVAAQQAPETGKPEPTPAEAAEGAARLAAAIKAQGGDAFLNLKSLKLQGKGTIAPPQLGGQSLPLESATLLAVVPDKARIDLKTPFGPIILASPGGGADSWMSAVGNVRPLKGRAGNLDPTALLRIASLNHYTVRPLPDLEDGKLHGLEIIDDKGASTKIYLDAQTNLVRRVDAMVLQQNSVISLSDYHTTEGIALPGKLVITQGGKTFLDLTFDTFEVNKQIDASVFERPKE